MALLTDKETTRICCNVTWVRILRIVITVQHSMEMVMEQWWNYTDREKLKLDRKSVV
jgi:hypothetical protein